MPSMKALKYGVFSGCTKLSSIGNLGNLEEIGGSCFSNCTSLTGDIVLPNLKTNSGSSSFYNTSIRSFIAQSLTGIAQYAMFSTCKNLTTVDIRNVTELQNNVFYLCTSLKDVNVDSVTIVGAYAFFGCAALQLVNLGSVVSIGAAAFTTCKSLIGVVIRATTPPTLADVNAFNETNNCPIYVPDASVNAYKAASNWSALASRIKPLSEYNG